ncbi:MAG: SpoIIE family protein phosphatase [Candidatus Poribacteria bacterium]|nr:SpoIIE family protein phosphatase [Candidatus Poribacteria bacterium]
MKYASPEEGMSRLLSFLSKLEEIGKTVISRQDGFESLSDAYLRLTLDTLEASEGAILRLDPTSTHFYVESSIAPRPKSVIVPVTLGEIDTLLQSSPIHLANLPKSLTALQDRIARQLQGLGSELWITLQADGELVGVIALGTPSVKIKGQAWVDVLLNTVASRLAAAMAHSRALQEMSTAKLRLLLLSDATAQISKLLDVKSIEKAAMNHVVPLLECRRDYLMLAVPNTRRLEVRSHALLDTEFPTNLQSDVIDLEAEQDGGPALSILRDVASSGVSQICNDANRVSPFGRRNLIAVPIFRREILGVLVVCDKVGQDNATPDFVDEDRILLEAFTYQIGVSIENARLYREALEKRRLQAEMEEAAKIQANLLPKAQPDIPGYDAAGLSLPHHDGVGGDYFDYIHEPDGSWGFVIADVSGKGMQAALLMVMLRTALRSEVARQSNLLAMAMRLNTLLYEGSIGDAYATLVYARLDAETGALTSVNAGHNYPIVLRGDGSMTRLEKGGSVVGMFPADVLIDIAEYQQETIQLHSGDTLLLYTDGVTDTVSPNGEPFEEQRLHDLARGIRHASANEMCTKIRDAVAEFQGDTQQFDDLTLLVLKRK